MRPTNFPASLAVGAKTTATHVITKLFTAAVLLLVFQASALAQGQFQSAATGNWGSASSWTLVSGSDPDGIPDSDDDVEIVSGHAITMTANQNAALLTVTNGSLSIGNYQLSVSGNISGNGSMTIGSGTLNAQSDLSISNLAVSGSATINIKGDWNIPDAGFNSSTSELIVFNGSGTQNINTPINNGTLYLNDIQVNKPNGTLTFSNFDVSNIEVISGTVDFPSLMGYMDGLLVSGGTVNLSSSTISAYSTTEVSSGTLNLDSATITFDDAYVPGFTVTVSGGTFNGGTGTIEFSGTKFAMTGGSFNAQSSTFYYYGGATNSDISSNQDITLNNISFERSGDRFDLAGSGGTRTFTINGTLKIKNYDTGGRSTTNSPMVLSSAALSYDAAGVLDYDRSSGIPKVGAEWPGSGVPNLRLSQGTVSLSSSHQVNTKLTRVDGAISGTVTYASGATLLYDPTISANLSIGDEWPNSNGPENVSIAHNGYSITGSTNKTVPGTLTLTAGTVDLSSNTLTVQGSVIGSDVAGSGTIADATTLAMGDGGTSTEAQTISGSITLNTLQVNKSGGATGSDNTVTITGGLTITNSGLINVVAGSLDLNGKTVDVSAGGVTLQVQSGAKLLTNGTSLTGFANYSVGSGTLVLGNSNNVEILPAGITVGTLEVDGSAGIRLSVGVLDVATKLQFTNGLIETSTTKSLRLTPSTTILGAGSSRYVDGPMQVEYSGTASADFPIGTGSNYRPATFEYTAFSSGGGNSIIEIQHSENSFTEGTVPGGISSIDQSGHYIISEKGTQPASYTYSITATFTPDNFTPETRNRILIQDSATPSWTVGDGQSIDTGANQVTVTGLTALPTNDGFLAFGAGGVGLYFTNGGSDNDWFNVNNWSTGSIPTSADSVIVSSGLSVTLGDASANGGMQSIKELVLETGASLTISASNTESTSLLVGDGVDADSVIQIASNATLTIAGGSVRSLAIQSGSELLYNNGSLVIEAGTGLGSGSGGSVLPTSRQIHTLNSAYTFKIAASNFQAQTYGSLTLEPQGAGVNDDKIRINETVHVQGDYLQSGGRVTFVDGATSGQDFNVDGSFTLSSSAQFIGSDGASGTNNFALGKDLTVGNSASFTVGTNLNFKLDGSGDQSISSSITSLSNLDVSGGGTKTLNGDLDVTDQLNMSGGEINTNGNVLTLGSSTTNVGSLNHSAGTIIGSFRRWVPTTTSDLSFPVGNDNGSTVDQRDARVQFASNAPDLGGTLTVTFMESDPGTDGLPLTDTSDSDYSIENAATTGFWRITAADGLNDPAEDFAYNIDLRADNFSGISDYTALHLIKRENSSMPWEVLGSHTAATLDSGVPMISRSGLTHFSEFTAGSGSENTLPVTLTSLKVTEAHSTGYPRLIWETATERENYGFYIQRANLDETTSDTSWTELAFVEGAGTTTQSQSYAYSDTTLETAGSYTYRLRQVDYDGQDELHGPVDFMFKAPAKIKLMSNYPNPFNPTTVIPYQLSETANVDLAVYDMAGRRVAQLVDKRQQPGQYKVTFNGQQLASGMYLIRYVSAGQQFTRKIMLIK
jgi:hypothetical protein